MPSYYWRFDRRRLVIMALLIGVILPLPLTGASALQGATRYPGPTNSGPIALSADGSLLASFNPDNSSVSLFDVGDD